MVPTPGQPHRALPSARGTKSDGLGHANRPLLWSPEQDLVGTARRPPKKPNQKRTSCVSQMAGHGVAGVLEGPGGVAGVLGVLGGVAGVPRAAHLRRKRPEPRRAARLQAGPVCTVSAAALTCRDTPPWTRGLQGFQGTRTEGPRTSRQAWLPRPRGWRSSQCPQAPCTTEGYVCCGFGRGRHPLGGPLQVRGCPWSAEPELQSPRRCWAGGGLVPPAAPCLWFKR